MEAVLNSLEFIKLFLCFCVSLQEFIKLSCHMNMQCRFTFRFTLMLSTLPHFLHCDQAIYVWQLIKSIGKFVLGEFVIDLKVAMRNYKGKLKNKNKIKIKNSTTLCRKK